MLTTVFSKLTQQSKNYSYDENNSEPIVPGNSDNDECSTSDVNDTADMSENEVSDEPLKTVYEDNSVSEDEDPDSNVFETELLEMINAERKMCNCETYESIPDPITSKIGADFFTCFWGYFNARDNILNKSESDPINPDVTHYIEWFDIRDLYDIYKFETNSDGYVVPVLICTDSERRDKLRNRRAYSYTAKSFSEIVDVMDKLCIRVEYRIFDILKNQILAG